MFLLGVTSTTTAPESVWGVENEGDDEGDDESDEAKGVIEQGKVVVENDRKHHLILIPLKFLLIT